MERLEHLEKYFDGMDLVITEGFKREKMPKIEVCRAERNKEPLCQDDNTLIALVTDTETNCKVPTFGLEEIKGLADLIEKQYL